MNPVDPHFEQRILTAIDTAFERFPDQSVTLEALLPHLLPLLPRPMTPRQIELWLNKYPTMYHQTAAGRWSLVRRSPALEADGATDTTTLQAQHDDIQAPVRFARITPGSYVVFDLETSGAWNGAHQTSDIEILQIAAQRYQDFTPVGEPFVSFIKPDRPISARITHLTRIRMEEVAEAPEAREVLSRFFEEYAVGLPLIAHNGALFDGPVLQQVTQRIGYHIPGQWLVLDTLPLARALLPLGTPSPVHGLPLENHRLSTLARFYGCEVSGAHRADVDILMLGGVVQGLLKELSGQQQARPDSHRKAVRFLVELLRRAADPWFALLDPALLQIESTCPDLAELFTLFGRHATPLLPQRQQVAGTGPTRQAVEELLTRYQQHGRERREAQVQLAHLAAQAMQEGCFAVIEAGTGTGKGLGYLAPAYLKARTSGCPVVVSTFTRVLQDQLYQSDLQFLHQVVGKDLNFALLKGQRNYLSSRCLAEELLDAFEEHSIEPGRAWGLMTLISFAIATADGDLSTIQSSFAGLGQLLATHQHTYCWLGKPEGAHSLHQQSADVWNLLERVRVTSEVPHAPWPAGLPRPQQQLDFWQRARENARRADIVVVNHALLLQKALKGEAGSAQASMDGSEESGVISPYLICDEAHTLEDAATAVLTRSIELRQLHRLLIALIGMRGIQGGAYAGLVKACRELGLANDDPTLEQLRQVSSRLVAQIEALGQLLRRFVAQQTVVQREDRARYGISVPLTRQSLTAVGGPALRQGGDQFVALLLELSGTLEALTVPIALQAQKSADPVALRRAARAERMRQAITDELREVSRNASWFWGFRDEQATVRVITFEPGDPENADWSLKGMPVAVGALLHSRLWSKLASAVITSATLTTWGDGFAFFLHRSGLSRLPTEKVITHVLPHGFDYRKHVLFLLPSHLPTPRDLALRKLYPEAVAAELLRFIPFFQGRTLVLFTSRARMEQVHELVVGELEQQGLPVLTQDDAEAIERFKAEENVSLMGVRALWEGVDVPGPALSFVLIEKFPFPSLGDPLEAARMAVIERAGGESFYDYLLPRAIFQFKQGFGRLIRKGDDHGAVVMLDKRLRSAMYRQEVLASLPTPTIGYESGVEMYRRIAEWMGMDFLPDHLPHLPQNKLFKLLEQLQLPTNIIPEEQWETVALPRIKALFQEIWGDRELYPFQKEAMRAVLAGRDVLTLAPTGSGKSLTYQIPALLRRGCTLVISPLIALIRDQVTRLREQYGLSMVHSLVSGMAAVEQEEVLSEARTGRIRLLYLAPERLRDPRFQALLPELPLVQVVVDEAHCIATWGHDFRPDFLEIPNLLNTTGLERVPVHALTATAPPSIRQEIISALRFSVSPDERDSKLAPLIHSSASVRQNLVYRVYPCASAGEGEAYAVELVKQLLGNREKGGPGIIYVATRARAERLAERLRAKNIAARAYHGGLRSAERHIIQELFMDGEIDAVCCTNAFGMGIDKQNIRFVIHYDHPSSIEAYAQETGRAGRDGKEAYAILLYSSATQRTHRFLARKGQQEQRGGDALLDMLSNSQAVKALPDGFILTSFEDLARMMGAEEAFIRVLIHSAEQAGLLQRGPDVVLEAGILLSTDISELVAHGDETPFQDPARRLLSHLLEQRASISNTTSSEPSVQGATTLGLRLHYDARRWVEAGGHPLEATTLLNQLSERAAEKFIFRPYTRGILLRLPHLTAAEREQALHQMRALVDTRYKQFEERLNRMLEYIQLPVGHCRQAYIENYLTGRADTPPCGKCDLCARNYPVPWNDLVIEANIKHARNHQEDRIGAALAILEALRDHQGTFSQNTFAKMLLGEGFGVRRDGTRYVLSATARNSEHFGSLKKYGFNETRLHKLLQQLRHQGYLSLETRSKQHHVDGDINEERYQTLTLTSRGRDILAGEGSLHLTADGGT